MIRVQYQMSDGKIDINEVIEKDNIVQDMEYMLIPRSGACRLYNNE